VSAALAYRHPPVLVAVALYGLFTAALVGLGAGAWARRGAPRHWSAAQVYGFVALAFTGSLGWWWVDGPVEGPATIVVTERHGVTRGDFLALPALVAAALVLAAHVSARTASSRRSV
jgi:hypothetical protein